MLGIPGATRPEDDKWDVMLREFLVSGSVLDLKGKELTCMSPKLWQRHTNLTVLDLSQNQLGTIPPEFAEMCHLKTLRL